MRTLYLDCGMGAAGDMLMGALLELLPEQPVRAAAASARETNRARLRFIFMMFLPFVAGWAGAFCFKRLPFYFRSTADVQVGRAP